MKTKTSLIIIFTIGLAISVGAALVDGYWGWESTTWMIFISVICLVIMVVNKIKK